MDDIKILTYLAAPVGAYVMWTFVIRPCAAWLTDKIPPGPIRDALTKDRGGHY